MAGGYRDTHPWPLFGLRITTPRLELRMPDDDDLAELFEAARAGIHAADEMPFGIPWTDGIQEPDAAASFLAFHWTARGAITPSTGRCSSPWSPTAASSAPRSSSPRSSRRRAA